MSENTSYFLKGLEVNHNPECYLEALSSILKFYGHEGEAIVNHFLGFCLESLPNDAVNVKTFISGEIDASVKNLSGIEINEKQHSCWEEYLVDTIKELKRGSPVIALIDTFYMEFFPKKNGHNLHALVIYGVDESGFHVKSAMPGDWVVPFENFKVASVSKVDEFSIRYQSVLVTTSAGEKREMPGLQDVLLINCFMMAEYEAPEPCRYGLKAIGAFKEYFSRKIGSMSGDAIDRLFKQLTSVVNQRKRYVKWLSAYPNTDHMQRHYEVLATAWEVFRNMCFKVKTDKDPEFLKRTILKVDQISRLEYSGISILRESLSGQYLCQNAQL